jgi:hypothetical protein
VHGVGAIVVVSAFSEDFSLPAVVLFLTADKQLKVTLFMLPYLVYSYWCPQHGGK